MANDMLNKAEVDRLSVLFGSCSPLFIALGDEVRQKLILDLAEASVEDANGINVTNLSAKSHLSRPAISHHLKVLKDSGLVKPVKVGTQIFYRLNLEDSIGDLADLISSIQRILPAIAPRPAMAVG